MATGDAEDGAEMPQAHEGHGGRKPPRPALGASSAAAGPGPSRPEGNERLRHIEQQLKPTAPSARPNGATLD